MSKFQDLWKSTDGKIGKAVQIVCEYETVENGRNTRIFESEHEYAEWIMQMGNSIKIVSMRKSVGGLLQKPGGSVHTAKWDRCIEHVRSTNSGADPYAVCTAMLGDESFKAMDEVQFNGMIDKALEKLGSFGIAGAGPIPESKLARQDLEGSTTRKFSPTVELVSRIKANQKTPMAKGGSFRDAWSRVKAR